MRPIKQECQVVGPGARIDTFMMQNANAQQHQLSAPARDRGRGARAREQHAPGILYLQRGNTTIYPRLDEIMLHLCKQTAGRREFLICMPQIESPGLIARPPQQRRACAADAAGRVIANFTRPACECTTYACTCASSASTKRIYTWPLPFYCIRRAATKSQNALISGIILR